MQTITKRGTGYRAPVKFAGKLRAVREAAGYSQTQLAALIGASPSHVSAAERLGKKLSEAKWQRLADILKSDVLTLRGWEKRIL